MMEPHSPAPTPAPEQSPTPPTTPEPTAPAPQPTLSQAPTPGTPQPPKKNNPPVILSIVGAVIIIAAIIIGFVVFGMNKKDNTDNSSKNNDSSKTDTKKNDSDLRSANAKTASSMSDLSVVCQNGSIKNAATFAKPYKFAVFSDNTARKSWSNITLSNDNESAVKYTEYAQANVIACLERDDSTAVKSMTCDFKSGGETTTVDYYAVKYKTTLYEAQSGKKIKELAAVSGPATSCPSFVTYNKNDPKIYGAVDKTELEANLAAFAQ